MKNYSSKKTLPVPLILVLPLLKTIFELGVIFFLFSGYLVFTEFFEGVDTTSKKVWLVIFLLTALFIFVYVRDKTLIGSKRILAKFYQNFKTRDIEKDWLVIEMFLGKTFYFPHSRTPISVASNLSLILMLICLVLNMRGNSLIDSKFMLLIGSPYLFFYVVLVVYLFEYKIED